MSSNKTLRKFVNKSICSQTPVLYFVNLRISSIFSELENNKKKKNKKPKWRFYFAQRATKLRYYGNVIHSFYCKSAVEHDGGV